ncbi:MFS transporter [Streptomyces werraensis]|uniref:MFS transporter n=1 Tax=Streptomyces werraensis TaxID=68284 RepID=UPI001CE369E9
MSLPPTPRGAERDDPVRNLPPSELRRARQAGFVETALENFDVVIHSTATATVFNQVFFLNVTPATGCVAGCGAYAVGFVTRPRRGLFLSRFGDRLGRKSVMVATLNLMGSATLTMGLLPACTQVGLLAPRLLVLCRFGQGFGAGAEMAGVVVLLTEFASRGERGSSTSMVWIGAPVGFIAAALIWIAVQQRVLQEALVTYGWRVLFLSSVCVRLAAYLIRRKTKESPVFAEVQQESETEAGSPLREVFLHGRRPLRRVFFINIRSHAHSYIYHAFVGASAHRHGPDRAGADAQDGALGRSLRRPGAFLASWASDRWDASR